MPRTLADGRIRLVALTTKPANPNAVTVAEVTAGKRFECNILKSDYRLSPTASDTLNEATLCASGNAVDFGSSNYEGSITVFRYLDTDGKPVTLEDFAWSMTKTKGTRLWLLESEGKTHDQAFVANDEYDLYEVVTDNPQKPGDRTGYIKRTVPLGVQDAWLDKVIAGA